MAASGNNNNGFVSDKTISRLVKDIVSLHKNPLVDQGIYYQHDSDNMLVGYAMIIGPEDTPYEHGFFFFRFEFPSDYPLNPPRVVYSTNDGKTRFHPNLYRNGKTCLSILNTWKGEGWTSCQTIRSVLLTLVSILDDNPLLNEPGIKEKNRDVIPYRNIIKFKTLQFAYLGMLDQYFIPDQFRGFHPFIKKYSKENREKIEDLCDTLVSSGPTGRHRVSIYNMETKIDYNTLQNDILDIHNVL